MQQKKNNRFILCILLCMILLLLQGCQISSAQSNIKNSSTYTKQTSLTTYTLSPSNGTQSTNLSDNVMPLAGFTPAAATTKTAAAPSWPASGSIPKPLSLPNASGKNTFTNSNVTIDLSNTSVGIATVALNTQISSNVKVWIHLTSSSSDTRYVYNLTKSMGTQTFPLQLGNGNYTIAVLQQQGSANSYVIIGSTTCNVAISNANAPYLLSNQFVNYAASPNAVSIARNLVSNISNNYARVSAVCSYVATHMTYNHTLAATVTSGYVPNIDQDLKKGSGICFDYAAITAGMLRSLGYPTKLVMGYTSDGTYHAWDSIYISGAGWVTVMSIKINTNNWSLVDVTFVSSSKASSQAATYVNKPSNYSPTLSY